MLTKQSNTQVYSPFGSYVVEQHDAGYQKPLRYAVPEPSIPEPPSTATGDGDSSPDGSKDMPQAA
jgi:hypothetical protein